MSNYKTYMKWVKIPLTAKFFGIAVAYGNTPWWSNTNKRQRIDHIIGIDRKWMRQYRVYIYHLVLFKLRVSFSCVGNNVRMD